MEPIQSNKRREKGRCVICGRRLPDNHLRHVSHLKPSLQIMVAEDVSGLDADARICEEDLSRYRRAYVEKLLNDERGELSELDRRVLNSIEKGASTVQSGADLALEPPRTLGERAADAVAGFGGSWSFIGPFCLILVLWMFVNVAGLMSSPFDPYPFILLNLVLSCLAALQAPIIMMSQRRQEDKDRQRAQNDYMVNLRAELEIRQLHEKIDHQMARQWERLAELQEIQIELLERNGGRSGRQR